jgi:hypothetical protein
LNVLQNATKKAFIPLLCKQGRKLSVRFRGTTRLAFLQALQAFKACEEFLLLYLIVAKVERPLSGYYAAWEPPTWSYLLLVGRVL